MRFRGIVALTLGFAVGTASARDYFVSPQGTGTEYSRECPGSLTGLNTLPIDRGQAHRFVLLDGVYDLSQVEYASSETAFPKRNFGPAAVVLSLYTRPRFVSESGDPARCILDGGNSGRGLAMLLGSNPIVAGITFRNFSPAGALFGVWSGVVSNCVFEGNSGQRGGAVGRSSCYGCVFRRNVAEECGGAILGAERVERCRFEDNLVRSGQGTAAAVAADYPWANPVIVDSVFERNHAAGDPAAERVVGRWCVTSNCTFRGNDTRVYGKRDGGPYVNSIRVQSGDDLRAAVDRLRRERDPNGRAELVFADGCYHLASNSYLRLDRRDDYLTLRAEHPGKVVFSGAYDWTLADFRRVTDARLLARLGPEAQKHVVAVPLTPEQLELFRTSKVGGDPLAGSGTHVYAQSAPYWNSTLKRLGRSRNALADGTEDYPCFALDGVPEPAARWPNENEFELKPAGFKTNGVNYVRLGSDRPRHWDFAQGRIAVVGKPNPWSHMAWPLNGGWSEEYAAVSNCSAVGAMHFENVLEELDRPGEWCVDFVTGSLCYYPRPFTPPAARCSLAHLVEPFVAAQNVTELQLQGIDFVDKVSLPAVIVANGERCRLERCRFIDINYLGADLTGWTNVVKDCDFLNVLNPIILAGGNSATLEEGNNVAENCRFENVRLNRRSGNGFQLTGCGNIIRHCAFLHHPHAAIAFGGPHHLIEYNRLVDTCSQNGDCGALYGWGASMSIGTVIRYNDIACTTGWGIYLDDCTSAVQVYGNLVRELGGWGVFLGGGRDLVVSNNVMYHAGGIQLDNRGLWWPSFRNFEGTHEQWIKNLNYTGGVWLAKHPNVARWHEDGTNMFAHTDSVFVNNLVLNEEMGGIIFNLAEFRDLQGPPGRLHSAGNVQVRRAARWHIDPKIWRIGGVEQFEGFTTNQIDLGFVDAPPSVDLGRDFHYRRGDFTLKPDAWLRRNCPQYVPIPFAEIGMYVDDWRREVEPAAIDWWMGEGSYRQKHYYVSPEGSGNEFSYDRPGRLLDALRSGKLVGDAVLVLSDGVYDLSAGEYGTVASVFGSNRQYGHSCFNQGGAKLTIRSASGNPQRCILDGGKSGQGRAFCMSDGLISGITFRNFACPESIGGALLWLWHGTASNCVFEANSALSGGAVSRGSYYDCVFRGNRAADTGGAIAGGELMVGCRFEDNAAVTNAPAVQDQYPWVSPLISNCVFRAHATNATHRLWSRWCRDLGGNRVE